MAADADSRRLRHETEDFLDQRLGSSLFRLLEPLAEFGGLYATHMRTEFAGMPELGRSFRDALWALSITSSRGAN